MEPVKERMCKRMKIMFLLFAAAVCGILSGTELVLPREACPEALPDVRNSWRQCGTIPLTYAAALSRFDLALRRQGWRKIRTVELDRVNRKSLELWERSGKRILLQYWRKDTALTGFAWGELTEGEQERS